MRIEYIRDSSGNLVIRKYDDSGNLISEEPVSTVQALSTVVKVQFTDASGNPVRYIQIDPTTGEATVNVEITIVDDRGNILPVDGQYLVPYRSALDERAKGEVLVSVTNGQGSKSLTFSSFQTGRYKIVASDILDASTMQAIPDVVFDPSEVVLSVVQ